MKNIQKKTARIISAVLNAPLVAFYTLLVLFIYLNLPAALSFFSVYIFFIIVFPTIIMFYMVKKRVIPDVYAYDRNTRTKPLLSVLMFQIIGVTILKFIKAPKVTVTLMIFCILNLSIITLITQIWKISIHVSGITGMATFLVHQLGSSMFPLFILILPVGWARIKLKAHSFLQVLAGFILPLICLNLARALV